MTSEEEKKFTELLEEMKYFLDVIFPLLEAGIMVKYAGLIYKLPLCHDGVDY